MYLLYPSDPLRTKQPDEYYAAELAAVRAAGFSASVFSLEEFQCGTFRPFPSIPTGSEVIYRGWMLSATDYELLFSALAKAAARPFTDLSTYLSTHHLPQWYPLLADLTPETRIYRSDCDLQAELRALDWPEYFIKDYVKSLKTSIGSRISTPDQVPTLVAEMHHFRGIIEGGFCVRRVEQFVPDSERRYFVIESVPHSSRSEVPPIVHECAKRLRSGFFSVDAVERTDGQLRVVEVGDGQVSDLVGWTPEQFTTILSKHF